MTLCKPESYRPIQIVEEPGQPKKVSVTQLASAQLATLGYCYLQDRGWFNNASIDEDGYQPWFTYPAIEALEDIINAESKVFEFGSGFSTLYLHNKVKYYASVEHQDEWVNELKKIEGSLNVACIKEGAQPLAWVQELIDEFLALNWDLPTTEDKEHDLMHGLLNKEFIGYASEIGIKPKGFYDIIVVDGMARALTGYLASKYISETGVIILDNSDRWHYNTLQKYLIESGFGRIDFWGPGTNRQDAWCTSFFSKGFKIKNNNPERPVGAEIIFT